MFYSFHTLHRHVSLKNRHPEYLNFQVLIRIVSTIKKVKETVILETGM